MPLTPVMRIGTVLNSCWPRTTDARAVPAVAACARLRIDLGEDDRIERRPGRVAVRTVGVTPEGIVANIDEMSLVAPTGHAQR